MEKNKKINALKIYSLPALVVDIYFLTSSENRATVTSHKSGVFVPVCC